MTKVEKPLSQFQIALQGFRRNRMAMACFWILVFFYLGAIFADFLSPYSFEMEDRDYSYCPPTKIHIFDEHGKFVWPYVFAMNLTFDDFHRRVYHEDSEKKYPLKFLMKAEKYRFLGVIPSQHHLWGVDSPGRIYLLGGDSRGRDLFSRILHGARISLSIGLIGVIISFSLGLIIGGIAGFYGGKIDEILMRVCEMIMMVPGFYLLLALRAAVPDNFNSVQVYFSIILILSFIGWAGLARIIRGMCLSLRTRDYVLAAKAMGLSDFQIIIKHILPHTLSYSIIAIMLSIPGYILGESGLSLLGLGIVDPYASWGNMLSEAMSIVHIRFAPWILWPGFLILVTVMCFNIIGDALRDCLDPKWKGAKE
ncbi:MAG: ABC transporter permease [Candidatus Omnitrophica bacterium]|nr:ABC transporter permease [Candidatus Omnitrophota bacterium]